MRDTIPSSFLSISFPAVLGTVLLALSGCPGDDTTTGSGGSSSGTTAPGTTAAPTTNDPTTSAGPGSSSSGPAATGDTTAGGTTTEAGTTMATGGSSSSGGTTMGVSAGSTGNTTEVGESSGTTVGVSGGSSTGVVFIQDPDVGAAIECSVWLQDCAAGEKCMPWANNGGSWNATMCSPIDPNPVGTGQVCQVVGSGTSGIDNCQLGAMCWDVDAATNEGTCVEMCTGSEVNPVCGPPGTSCVISNDGVLILCLDGCDPLQQTCPMGQACYPINDLFTCAPDASGAQGFDDDPCEFINVCDPGLACLGAGAVANCASPVGCCSPFCDVTDPVDPCPAAAEQCVAWYAAGQAPPGLENVGVCSLP